MLPSLPPSKTWGGRDAPSRLAGSIALAHPGCRGRAATRGDVARQAAARAVEKDKFRPEGCDSDSGVRLGAAHGLPRLL